MRRGEPVLHAPQRLVFLELGVLLRGLFWRCLQRNGWRHLRRLGRTLHGRHVADVLQRAHVWLERPVSGQRRWHRVPRVESDVLRVVAMLCRVDVQWRVLRFSADVRLGRPAVLVVLHRVLLRTHLQQQRLLCEPDHVQADGRELYWK